MEYRNLTIIGTSHIARESIEEVRNTIFKEKPDIIALELDRKRLYALMHKKKEKLSIYNILKMLPGLFPPVQTKSPREHLNLVDEHIPDEISEKDQLFLLIP